MASFYFSGDFISADVGATPLTAHAGVIKKAGVWALAGSGEKADGVVDIACAALTKGVAAVSWKKATRILVATTGTLIDTDYVKWTTGGLLTADASSGATALSANTVGRCDGAPDANGNCWIIPC